MSRLLRVVAIGLVVITAAVAAQEPFMWRGGWGRRFPPRFPTAESFDGRFTFCRLMFTSAWREPSGSGWNTDYPGAENNLAIRTSELTKIRINFDAPDEPSHYVVRMTDDPSLFQCPFTLASDVGTIGLSQQEAARLGQYLRKGGFLWVDDLAVDPAILVPKRWDAATTADGLTAARATIADIGQVSFEADELEPPLRALAEDRGWKAGDLFMAIRVAVTGRTATPPLFDTLVALGYGRTLDRLDRAIETLAAAPAGS